jgi:hypothetical protein
MQGEMEDIMDQSHGKPGTEALMIQYNEIVLPVLSAGTPWWIDGARSGVGMKTPLPAGMPDAVMIP